MKVVQKDTLHPHALSEAEKERRRRAQRQRRIRNIQVREAVERGARIQELDK